VTEDRKADLDELRRVAVEAPDDEARQAGRLGLEDGQVTDARLIEAASVVDDEHVTGLRAAERFEEASTLP
jgi:hypothetical protein